jgi:hypothetical protein
MATTYKAFNTATDVISTRTLLHEAIPLTGALLSGTYTVSPNTEENIKNFSHGMFQSVFDYPYLSSSANHVMDLTVGYAPDSALSGATNIQNAKKINIYNQMAQVLMGHSVSGTILRFSRDGKVIGGSRNMKECIFMNFSRLLSKDEIKKGSFTLKLGVNPHYDKPFRNSIIKVQDTNAENDYRVNSPAGEYGILYMTNDVGTQGSATDWTVDDTRQVGLLFYQAGIAVVTSSVFQVLQAAGGVLTSSVYMSNGSSSAFIDTGKNNTLNTSINGVLTGSAISGACSEIRHRIYDISFNNTTELNSSIYFCRVNHNDFNYSSNPTYLSASKIRVKNTSTDAPVAYITGVGLYSPDNELMAVAKLSEPLKKDPTNELTLRVRLDY